MGRTIIQREHVLGKLVVPFVTVFYAQRTFVIFMKDETVNHVINKIIGALDELCCFRFCFLSEYMNVWMERWTSEWLDARTKERMNGWMLVRVYICVYSSCLQQTKGKIIKTGTRLR